MRFPTPFLVLASLLISGCGDGARSPSDDFCGPALARVDSFMATFQGQEPEGERYGGTAVVGTVGELNGGMNTFGATQVATTQHLMFVHNMTLVQYDVDLRPIPYLAESWERSEDLLDLTFRLRDDVYWHDGERTTAYDVEFTYLRAIDPETGFPNSSFFRYYTPGAAGVEVVDSFTVRFHFDKPDSDPIDPWRTVAIMPRHLLEDVPPSELTAHPISTICPVGNGPFRFFAHDPRSQWVFEANPAFPEGLGGRPYLDRYVYRILPEASTLLAELLTGGVDIYFALLPHFTDQVEEAEEDLELVVFKNRSVFFAAWNGRSPKLSDVRVRRALTVGTNRRQILDGLRRGRGAVANTGVPLTHWLYDPSLSDSLPYDPDQASSLLTAAGWEDRDGDGVRENEAGDPLSIELVFNSNQERQETAEIMRAQLREIGVDLQPRELDLGAWFERITSADREGFEGALISWEAEFRLDERDLFHSEAVNGPLAFAGTQDPVLDRYLDTLLLIPDRDAAYPLWQEYQLRIIELQPYTFLNFPDRQDGVNRRLRDVEMDVRGEWLNVNSWWIAPEDRRTP